MTLTRAMMEPMSEEHGPVYRASPANRTAAWVVVAASIGVVLWAILTVGGISTKAVTISAVFAVFALLAAASLRFRVQAEPRHLVVCWGGPVRRIPWSEIKGFGVDDRKGRRGVYLVMGDKQKRRLPLSDVSAGKISATEVRDALQRYWKAHRR
jgi:hypothetical protein